MSEMKKKKKKDEIPVNKNRSDTKNSKAPSSITTPVKGAKGKK